MPAKCEGTFLKLVLSATASRICPHEDEHFITVASHGFPLDEETVYHPTPSGRVIGKVERCLGETDIALVKLDPGRKDGQQETGPSE
jgi:hypothetical protein